MDSIIKRKIKKEAAKQGIDIECSFYLEGAYDWIFCISTSGIKQMKIFVENLHKVFRGYISDVKILEAIFTLEKDGFPKSNINHQHRFADNNRADFVPQKHRRQPGYSAVRPTGCWAKEQGPTQGE